MRFGCAAAGRKIAQRDARSRAVTWRQASAGRSSDARRPSARIRQAARDTDSPRRAATLQSWSEQRDRHRRRDRDGPLVGTSAVGPVVVARQAQASAAASLPEAGPPPDSPRSDLNRRAALRPRRRARLVRCVPLRTRIHPARRTAPRWVKAAQPVPVHVGFGVGEHLSAVAAPHRYDGTRPAARCRGHQAPPDLTINFQPLSLRARRPGGLFYGQPQPAALCRQTAGRDGPFPLSKMPQDVGSEAASRRAEGAPPRRAAVHVNAHSPLKTLSTASMEARSTRRLSPVCALVGRRQRGDRRPVGGAAFIVSPSVA